MKAGGGRDGVRRRGAEKKGWRLLSTYSAVLGSYLHSFNGEHAVLPDSGISANLQKARRRTDVRWYILTTMPIKEIKGICACG